MAPPVFLLESLDGVQPGDVVALAGAEGHHAATVMRLRAGDCVEVVDGAGTRAGGEIVSAERGGVQVRVDSVVIEPLPEPRLVVVQALAKGDRGERAVEMLTEVGVDVIVPWSARHCVSVWKGEKADKGVEKWRATARTATKQSRRAFLPDVRPLHDTAMVRELIGDCAAAFVLDEAATPPIGQMPLPAAGDIVLIVGPEGGIAPDEIEEFVSAGARPALVGPSVLRTSTAGTVAATVVLAGTRWRRADA